MSSRTSERQRVRKGLIDKAISEDVLPSFPRGSANFTLKLDGGKRALLVRSDNTFTKEGEYWSAKTGKALPQGIDYSQKTGFPYLPIGTAQDSNNRIIYIYSAIKLVRTNDTEKVDRTYFIKGCFPAVLNAFV